MMASDLKLRSPKDLYRDLVKESPVAQFSVDNTARIYIANRSAAELLGYPIEGLIGRPIFDLYADTPSGKEKAKNVFEKLRAGEEHIEVELEMCRLSGELLNVLLWVHPILDADANVIARRVVIIDISHRLCDQKLQLENLLNKFEDAVIILDPTNDKILHINDKVASLLGYSEEELLTLPVSVIYPAEMDTFHRFADKARKERKAWTDKLTCRTKNGKVIPIEITASLIDIGNSTLVFFLVKDIRNTLLTTEQYRKLLMAVEQSPASVIMTDKNGTIEYVNPKFEQITGYNADEVIGKNPRILKSGNIPKDIYEDLWQTILDGRVWRGELHNKKKGGELYWEYATISPMLDSDRNITNFIAVKEDITQQKKLEDQLKHAQKMEAIGQLAGGIAHDINNVLGIIRGSNHILTQEITDPKLKRFISMIENAVDRGASITGRLLIFARKEESLFQNIDIVEIINDVHQTLEHTIEHSIKFNINVPATLPPLWGNRGDIYQMLVNLCLNGRDAIIESDKTDGSAITIQASIVKPGHILEKLHQEVPLDHIELSISDTGKGMAGEIKQRLFEPYFTTKSAGKGTGLGLSIVYGIVKVHRGYIDVESEVEKGTTFTIYLPVSQVKERSETIIREIPGLEGRESILLIEDESELREIVIEVLSQHGYRIHTAEDGLDAISIFTELHDDLDLVVLDLGLPVVSGRQVLRKIREKNSTIPVIVASGYVNPSMKNELLGFGVTTMIQKPYKSDELLTSIREALKERK
jgi:PAS domain S-box-containing protein